jgi:hypothetical protein
VSWAYRQYPRHRISVTLWTVGATVLALLALLVVGAAGDEASPPAAGVDPSKVPQLAKAMLPLITQVATQQCPELPPLWVVAQVQAESGWNPRAFSADRNGGSAGLYQMNQANWVAAGGTPWESTPPPAEADVLAPTAHLRRAIPWVCANLRAATGHLVTAGKPTAPLDAMLVCHIAGCGRVTASATGIPREGEAGCSARCVQLITRYVYTVHRYVESYTAPAGGPGSPKAPQTPASPVPVAYTGPITACAVDDPTTGGCLTATTAYGLSAMTAAFGPWHNGPMIHSTGCWSQRPASERSDHPAGKACDVAPGVLGRFATGEELAHGWQIANWFRTYNAQLHVKYLIWQGRYWDPSTKDAPDAWGTRYTGAGIYNVNDPTGGHFDHVHVSFED